MSNITPFRYWCHKVLPLVYDDSLSYYELLCKVVEKLNEVIELTDETKAIVDELKNYVDNYFGSPEFEQLINDKLDEMAQDGTLASIINEELFSGLNTRLDTVETKTTENTSQITMNKNDITALETKTSQLNAGLKQMANLIMKSGSLLTSNIIFTALSDNAANTVANKWFGNCCVLTMLDNDVNDGHIVFDFGNGRDASVLINYIASQRTNKVVAVVISHYHDDHVTLAKLNQFLNSSLIDTSDCHFYLPHGEIDWGSFTGVTYQSVETAVINSLTTHNISYTRVDREGYSVDFGQVKVTFHNVAANKFGDYYNYMYDEDMNVTENTNYNNFSMISKVMFKGHTIVLPADVEQPAEKNNANVVAGADIFVVNHHGLNLKSADEWIDALSPSISILCAYGVRSERVSFFAPAPVTKRCADVGSVWSTVNGVRQTIYITKDGNLNAAISATNRPVPPNEIGQLIPDGTDFNTIRTPGTYFIQNVAHANTMVNKPESAGAGKLICIAPNQNYYDQSEDLVQFYIPMFSYADPVIFQRFQYGINTWSKWYTYKPTSQ